MVSLEPVCSLQFGQWPVLSELTGDYMNDDLLKRLRDKNCCDASHCNCDEAADEIERLLANAKEDAMWMSACLQWCKMNGVAPSSSDLIAARAALGEKKDGLG
jgi:hypothetical protein